MYVLYGNELKKQGKLDEAKQAYIDGITVPKSYGEAKTFFNQEAHIFYYLGLLSGEKKDFEEAAIYKAAVSELFMFRASHDSVPYGYLADSGGKITVSMYLDECEHVIKEIVEFTNQHPTAKEEEVAKLFNMRYNKVPPINYKTVENIKKLKLGKG